VLDLPAHRFKVAVLQPQIAPNTGSIARLCVATGTELHLVRPMGFILSHRELKRAAMDYWPRLKLTVHDDNAAFFAAVGSDGFWLFTSKGEQPLWETGFADGDWLIFGNETRGFDPATVAANQGRAVRIPQAPGERCLNLATAAGIGLFAALRCVAG